LGLTRLLVSSAIVAEMEATLARPKFARHFKQRETEPRLFISDYTSLARFITPVPVTDCPIDDPKDLKFIECAVTGEANYIVSGDQHLLKLLAFRGIPILTPAQFLQILTPPTGE